MLVPAIAAAQQQAPIPSAIPDVTKLLEKDQQPGLNLTLPISSARLNLAYVWLESNSGARSNTYTAELKYDLNGLWRLSLGAQFLGKDANGMPMSEMLVGKPTERWYNVGLAYNLNQIARLSFIWQFSDIANPQAPASPVAGFASSKDGRSSNNLISTQLTIKF